MDRSKYKHGGLIPKDDTPGVSCLWDTGDDVPVTWDEREIALLRFRCFKKNYFLGHITGEKYRQELKRWRDYENNI